MWKKEIEVEITFKAIGLEFIAEVRYKPEVVARRIGHPDNWDEGEEPELEFITLEAVTKIPVYSRDNVPVKIIGYAEKRDNAMFLLGSSMCDGLESKVKVNGSERSWCIINVMAVITV